MTTMTMMLVTKESLSGSDQNVSSLQTSETRIGTGSWIERRLKSGLFQKITITAQQKQPILCNPRMKIGLVHDRLKMSLILAHQNAPSITFV